MNKLFNLSQFDSSSRPAIEGKPKQLVFLQKPPKRQKADLSKAAEKLKKGEKKPQSDE